MAEVEFRVGQADSKQSCVECMVEEFTADELADDWNDKKS